MELELDHKEAHIEGVNAQLKELNHQNEADNAQQFSEFLLLKREHQTMQKQFEQLNKHHTSLKDISNEQITELREENENQRVHIEELTRENYDTCKELNELRKTKELETEETERVHLQIKQDLEADLSDKSVEIEDLRQ